jgi:nicotinamide-nucleotide adenylyltransferase
MTDTGVVHGRFQVFHLDHLKYVLAAGERCRRLIIGITNPDPMLTKNDAAAPHRSTIEANPLTYFERYTIIQEVLLERGLDPGNFSIVPFPVNFPELYRYYLPLDAVFFLTIYDEWGNRKLEIFRSMGLNVEILWTRPPEEKGISATEVRERMSRGERWEYLVPPVAASVMKKMKIPERLGNITSGAA